MMRLYIYKEKSWTFLIWWSITSTT